MDEISSAGLMQGTENGLISDPTDLFRDAKTELTQKDGRWIVYEPINLNSQDEFIFNIPPQGLTYLNLRLSRLQIEAKIVHEDNTDIPGGDDGDSGKIAFLNLPGSSMFSNIDISLDGNPLSDLSNSYAHYKAYLDTIMSYSDSAAICHLRSAHFAMDDPGKFDVFNATNDGFGDRASSVGASETFTINTPLYSDFFQIEKLFPPGVKLTLKLVRAPNKFVICTSLKKTYKIVVQSIKLWMRHITLFENIVQQHQRLLAADHPVILPFRKTEIVTFAFANNLNAISVKNMISGTLPRSVIIGFVHSDDFHGTFDTNAYNFRHLDIDFLQLDVGGVYLPPHPYKPDFTNNLYQREYRDFFDNIGISQANGGNMINSVLYKEGCTLFAFDLTPDLCNGFHVHPRHNGNITLDVHFKNPLKKAINVIAMCIYDAKLTLERKTKPKTQLYALEENK
jgi:hypothetical protein